MIGGVEAFYNVIDGDLVEILVDVSDADGDALELLLEGGPEGSILSEGVFSWQTGESVGVYDLTFTVQEVGNVESGVSVSTRLEVFAAEGAIIRNLRAEGHQQTVTLNFDLQIIGEGQADLVVSLDGNELETLVLDPAPDQSIELDTSAYGLDDVTVYTVLVSTTANEVTNDFQVEAVIDNKVPEITDLPAALATVKTGDRFPIQFWVNDNGEVGNARVIFEGPESSILSSLVQEARGRGNSFRSLIGIPEDPGTLLRAAGQFD
jgi:hypothetical protein